ncbi:MAG: hypothetical protein EOP52_06280 [Sphingobacteriales bacterium]|nr:MAG: hypothetical protein EOP52_06280 [Sphingobacteriales bacterium]
MSQPNGNTNKQFASQGSKLFLVRALPAAAVLVVMVLYARRLPQELYGQYQNFWVRYGLLSTFTTLGLPSFFLLLSPPEVTGFWKHLSIRQLSLFGVVNLGCCALFSYWERLLFPGWIPAVFLLVWTCGLVLESILISFRKLNRLLVINVLFAGLFLPIHWLLLPEHTHSLTALFEGIGLLALLRAGVLGVWVLQVFRTQTAVAPIRSRKIWLHLTLTDLIQQSSRMLDKVLLGLLTSPARSAIYFNGAQEVPFLPALLGAASGNVLLHASNGREGASLHQKAHWLRLSGALLGALVFPMFWWLLLGRDAVFELVFAGRYPQAAPVFAVFTCALPLRAYPFSALLQHLRLGAVITIGAFFDLIIAIGLALVLYPIMGLPGIALAFTIATVLLAGFYTWQTVQKTGLSPALLFPLKTWVVQFGGAGIAGAVPFYLSQTLGWTAASELIVSGTVLLLLAMVFLRQTLVRSRAGTPVDPAG